MILAPDVGLFGASPGLQPEAFEISDQRMSEGMLNGVRIFRLPSNAELHLTQNRYVYRTRPFPSWKLCTDHSMLYVRTCPHCSPDAPGRLQAIRFVRACDEGHLDDVDWDYVVHGNAACGQTGAYIWRGGGAALSQVRIGCPNGNCGREVSLGAAYGRDWPCSGRLPEREAPYAPAARHPGACNSRSRIIQRQASHLRIPELRTLFTVPPRATRLHNLLQLVPVRSVIVALQGQLNDLGGLEAALGNLVANGLVPAASVAEIVGYPWAEIEAAIEDVLSPVSHEFDDLLLEEFGALMEASEAGYPPVHGSGPASPVVFEVVPQQIVDVEGPNGTRVRVVPVSRLRSVTVQEGYRRMGQTGRMVSNEFSGDDGQRWLPGAEHLGEGIFITLTSEGAPLDLGNRETAWLEAFSDGAGYPEGLFRGGGRDELHPTFVWWHTLAHALIRYIAVDSGYSSASIRERVYLDLADSGARGGIILYTVQPGADGTLGGLVALVARFQEILVRALEAMLVCSNDPLCSEIQFAAGGYNGPACYGCLLISETSCEHRNMWLDRMLLLEGLQ